MADDPKIIKPCCDMLSYVVVSREFETIGDEHKQSIEAHTKAMIEEMRKDDRRYKLIEEFRRVINEIPGEVTWRADELFTVHNVDCGYTLKGRLHHFNITDDNELCLLVYEEKDGYAHICVDHAATYYYGYFTKLGLNVASDGMHLKISFR